MHTENYRELNAAWNEIQEIENQSLLDIVSDTKQQKYILLLTVRVLELCKDCVSLLDIKRISSVPIILRSALESYLDLKCMIEDEDHLRIMNNEYNHFMAGLSASLGDGETKKYLERVQSGRGINTEGKFKRAGEHKLYKKFYIPLSRHTHGNLERLVVEHTANGVVTIGALPNKDQFLLTLNQVISLKAIALEECLSFFGKKDRHIKKLQTIKEKLNQLDDA